MKGVVIRHVDPPQRKPPGAPFATSRDRRSLHNHRTHPQVPFPLGSCDSWAVRGRLEILRQEGEHLLPSIDCRPLAIGGPVAVKEAMAGSGIHVELVSLAVLLQRLFMLGDL